LMLIPPWGIVGAALAFSVSYLSMAGILLWIVAKRLHLSLFRLVTPWHSDLVALGSHFKGIWFRVLSLTP